MTWIPEVSLCTRYFEVQWGNGGAKGKRGYSSQISNWDIRESKDWWRSCHLNQWIDEALDPNKGIGLTGLYLFKWIVKSIFTSWVRTQLAGDLWRIRIGYQYKVISYVETFVIDFAPVYTGEYKVWYPDHSNCIISPDPISLTIPRVQVQRWRLGKVLRTDRWIQFRYPKKCIYIYVFTNQKR
jgi:hypothetical protein